MLSLDRCIARAGAPACKARWALGSRGAQQLAMRPSVQWRNAVLDHESARRRRLAASSEDEPSVSKSSESDINSTSSPSETSPEPEVVPEPSPVLQSSPEPFDEDAFQSTAEDIKAALLDTLFGTDRGLKARSEVRAEINELISQLEAKNPTPNPTEVLDKLNGDWRLIYTCNSALVGVLALGNLPLVSVGDMVQRIDSESMSLENKVNLSGPFSKTAISTTASFEVRSPKRLQLKLERGKVATPELTGDLDLPTSVSVLGQTIDLTQLKDAIAPVKDQAEGVLSQLNQLVMQVPELNVPIQNKDAQTWQLTTYVDEDLRVSRGDGGAVFVYSRM